MTTPVGTAGQALLGSATVPGEPTMAEEFPEAPRGRRLTREEVVDAALRLTGRVGLSHVTMVELAKELGVSTMATYYYVRNKQALLDLVAEAVMARVPTAEPGTDWEEGLRAYALALWTVLSDYPGVARHLLTQRLTSTARARIANGRDGFREAGFDPHTSGLAHTTFRIFVFGLLSTQVSAKNATRPGEPRPIPEYVEFGINTVLAGLRQQLTDAM